MLGYFNPHPHAEGDWKAVEFHKIQLISIHTLSQRVTDIQAHEVYENDISIHTLTQRVTKRPVRYTAARFISIHTLTQRVTLRHET